MTWFMKPCVTELKAVTRQFRKCISCFSQKRQQVSLSHKSVTLYTMCVICIFNKKLNTDSNNSMLDANFSETIIQIANYNKGPKQRQRKAIPSAHLKWVPGYLDANFYDTEQKNIIKTAFYRFVQNSIENTYTTYLTKELWTLMSQLELYKSLWSVKLYRLSGLRSSDENAVQKVTVIINIRLVQRSPKCVTIQRVTLQPMRPKSQHASHCNFHRRNNRRVIHASLFAIMFITLFFQDKEFWWVGYSATTLQELSLYTRNRQFMRHCSFFITQHQH